MYTILQGATKLRPVQKEMDGQTFAYTHHQSVAEIQRILKDIVDEQLLQKLKMAGYFAVEADESTDVANKSILIVYVR